MLDDTQALATLIDVEDATSWCEEEFSDVELGDKRLNRRLIRTAIKLTMQPTAPINQACEDWATTKASDRLFDNDKVVLDKILEPRQQQTQERMKASPLVLAVQDTSYLNYTSHTQTEGLGPIGTEEQNLSGLLMHPTLILTPAGLPLGVLTQEIWARAEDASELTQTEKKNRPIEEKESCKWLKGLEKTVELTPEGVEVPAKNNEPKREAIVVSSQ
ncbi:MAG TPA: transposase [Chloroflexi bacterium]|nr:transposase [Chloroflexota bacterium]